MEWRDDIENADQRIQELLRREAEKQHERFMALICGYAEPDDWRGTSFPVRTNYRSVIVDPGS